MIWFIQNGAKVWQRFGIKKSSIYDGTDGIYDSAEKCGGIECGDCSCRVGVLLDSTVGRQASGVNSIISLLSLSRPASLKDVTDNDAAKMLQIVMSEMNDLRTDVRKTIRRHEDRDRPLPHEKSMLSDSATRVLMAYDRFRDTVLSETDAMKVKAAYDRFQYRFLCYAEESEFAIPAKFASMQSEVESLMANFTSKGDTRKT